MSTRTLPPNGRTLRTFEHAGYMVSEVEFFIEDRGGHFIGYMVGKDDGRSTLYTTPDAAVAAVARREASHA